MSEKTYAVESYNPDDGYHRHVIGTKEQMKSEIDCLINQSLDNKSYDSYYRINEVTEQDETDWYEQEQNLPDVKPTDRLFGEWVQINVASKYLGVTFGRVFNLVTAQEIRCNKEGRNKLVNVHDVVERKISKPRAGRPPFKKDDIDGLDETEA